MMNPNDKIPPLLEKELDLIDNTISRLDAQIQTSKNICFTLWTAWMGWFIAQQIHHENEENFGLAVMASALFILIFWLVDFEYRKALLLCSRRRSLISLYLNGILVDDLKDESRFPVLDPLGNLFDYENLDLSNTAKVEFTKGINEKGEPFPKKKWYQICVYKEAKWIYPPLILISIITGYLLECST